MKKVFLIILNWNGWKMTLNCLRSLENIKNVGFSVEVVVVDNGSTDGSVEKIQNSKFKIQNCNSKLTVIKNKTNLGFAEGNNIGIRYTLNQKADYICLLNNDTRVDSVFLEELIKSAEDDGQIGMVGGKIYFEKGYEFHKDRYKPDERGRIIWYAGGIIDWQNVYASHRGVDEIDRGQYEIQSETDYVNGCLMLVKRNILEKVGLFDSKYFLYYEDADLSLRVKKAGFKLIYCPTARVWHLNAGSSKSGSDLHDYFTTRNRLLFGMKYAPLRSKMALLKESVSLIKRGRRWQKIGVRDFYLGKFGKGSWGK